MTALVTGANGGLGRILCAALRERFGEEVAATSRNCTAGDAHFSCDLTDAKRVADIVRRVRPRVVYHLAGSFSNDYAHDFPVNVHSAHILIGAIRNLGLATRIVILGSAAEYGVVAPEDNPIREDHALRPVSIYGVTKACQTHVAQCAAATDGADVVVARLFNLFAPGLSDRLFLGRAERLIDRYKRNEIEILEMGNLASVRDYVDADQAIAQLRLIARHGQKGEIYHVASGRPVVMRDVLARMLTAAGVAKAPVVEQPSTAIRRGYDVPVIYADMRRTLALERTAS
jgi:GDP-4-dehydro-6-deoxy-D-mannose reductase